MASHSPRVYLLHMRDCCERLIECAALRGEETIPVFVVIDAVCRNLEVLGEASRKIGLEFRAANPEMPWRQMSDLRNVLIHNYEVADADLIWGIVEREIPELLRQLNGLLLVNPE